MEAANELVDCMQSVEAEARAALTKAKDDMARYYNRCCTPAPVFAPGDKVYLEVNDIATTRPSAKLSHCRLGPYEIDQRVGTNTYRLLLPLQLRRLHLVFNVIKLTPALVDPIPGRISEPPPPPELFKGKLEYEVNHVLDSRLFRCKLQYKIRWKGYNTSHDSWEAATFVANAPEAIADFHRANPRAPRQIRAADFDSISFQHITSERYDSEGGVIPPHALSPPM